MPLPSLSSATVPLWTCPAQLCAQRAICLVGVPTHLPGTAPWAALSSSSRDLPRMCFPSPPLSAVPLSFVKGEIFAATSFLPTHHSALVKNKSRPETGWRAPFSVGEQASEASNTTINSQLFRRRGKTPLLSTPKGMGPPKECWSQGAAEGCVPPQTSVVPPQVGIAPATALIEGDVIYRPANGAQGARAEHLLGYDND